MSTDAADEDLRETAARWHDRLTQESVPTAVREAFLRWLDESSEHRVAYEAIENAWRIAQSAARDPAILELRHEAALRLTRKRAWTFRAPWVAAAVVACVVVVLMLMQYRSTEPLLQQLTGAAESDNSQSPATQGRYATRIGERLVIPLNDGSQVTLNTDSEFSPAFVSNERRVVLMRGQAVFEVAKDPSRPFVVEARGRRFVAVGTAFDVRLDGGQVQVTMLEGTVRVERAESNPHILATVTIGEQLTLNETKLHRVRVENPERVSSWRQGQLIFENSRLADAVAELNRYSATRIVLAEPDLAELRISGAFSTARPRVFVEALTLYFPIDVVRDDASMLLLGKRDGSPRGE